MLRSLASAATSFHRPGSSLSELAPSLRDDLRLRLPVTIALVGMTGPPARLAARRLAASLGRELLRIDLHAVVSKYIGETEKNLESVFGAAEASGAVLFFDEADALLGRRSEVRDSHDRYSNIEINDLLQRLERYAGLLVLALSSDHPVRRLHARRRRVVIPHPNG